MLVAAGAMQRNQTWWLLAAVRQRPSSDAARVAALQLTWLPPPCCPAVSKCIQLSISGADPEALTLLRDRVNRTLLRCAGVGGGSCAGSENSAASERGGKTGAGQAGASRPARRPLAPRSLNTLGGTVGAASSVISLRSGPGSSVAPAASGFSLGVSSRPGALASSADSSAAAVGSEEDLGDLSDEQRRALELVRSGRSIFFTGGLELLDEQQQGLGVWGKCRRHAGLGRLALTQPNVDARTAWLAAT